MIQKPARWRVINANNIQAHLAHQRQIDLDLLRAPEIIPFAIRFERTVRHAPNENFVAVEKISRQGELAIRIAVM
jgi:hypothetical protein